MRPPLTMAAARKVLISRFEQLQAAPLSDQPAARSPWSRVGPRRLGQGRCGTGAGSCSAMVFAALSRWLLLFAGPGGQFLQTRAQTCGLRF
eukprot:COSAG01_NODE_8140_length_2902_cov_56.215889_5_plen_91_part_00